MGTSELKIIPNDTEVYIGIDPDVGRNGVAYLNTKRKTLTLSSRIAPNLWEFLLYMRDHTTNNRYVVIIEASWLIQSNWHVSSNMTKGQVAQVGHNTGRNHQVGISIAEFCEYHKIPYFLAKPLKKCWLGQGGKITHNELAYFSWITEKRSNQEERDAAMLAWTYAKLPIRIRVCDK